MPFLRCQTPPGADIVCEYEHDEFPFRVLPVRWRQTAAAGALSSPTALFSSARNRERLVDHLAGQSTRTGIRTVTGWHWRPHLLSAEALVVETRLDSRQDRRDKRGSRTDARARCEWRTPLVRASALHDVIPFGKPLRITP